MGRVPFRTTGEKALRSVYSLLSSRNSLNWPSPSHRPISAPWISPFYGWVSRRLAMYKSLSSANLLPLSLYFTAFPSSFLLFLMCLPSPLFVLYPLSLKWFLFPLAHPFPFTQNGISSLHCKKRLAVSPSPGGMSLTTLPWPEKMELFPAKESLVSHIPAGDVKNANLFLQCICFLFPFPVYLSSFVCISCIFPPFPSDPDSFRQCGVIKNAYRKNPPWLNRFMWGLRGTG